MIRILICTLITVFLAGSSALSTEEKLKIYRSYSNLSELEEVDPDVGNACFDDKLFPFLCPSDEKTPCGPIEGIEKFCSEQVGDDTTALKGCLTYVGYYVEDEQWACCPSEFCDEWLDERLGEIEDDEEDLEYGEDEDPEF